MYKASTIGDVAWPDYSDTENGARKGNSAIKLDYRNAKDGLENGDTTGLCSNEKDFASTNAKTIGNADASEETKSIINNIIPGKTNKTPILFNY